MYYDPSISVVELRYGSHPVLEIKRDDDDFFSGMGLKRRFRFGLLKAKMFLTCLPLIEEFLESQGRKPASNLVHCMNNGPYGILCSCTKYGGFKPGAAGEIAEALPAYRVRDSEDRDRPRKSQSCIPEEESLAKVYWGE